MTISFDRKLCLVFDQPSLTLSSELAKHRCGLALLVKYQYLKIKFTQRYSENLTEENNNRHLGVFMQYNVLGRVGRSLITILYMHIKLQ